LNIFELKILDVFFVIIGYSYHSYLISYDKKQYMVHLFTIVERTFNSNNENVFYCKILNLINIKTIKQ